MLKHLPVLLQILNGQICWSDLLKVYLFKNNLNDVIFKVLSCLFENNIAIIREL